MSEARKAGEGAREELSKLFAGCRDRLRTMVSLRLDPRLKGRVDASDVIQEAFLEATERYDDYVREPRLAPYLWLRFLTMQQLLIHARRHLQAQARAAGREVSLDAVDALDVSSLGLADLLLDSITSP